MQPKAVFLTLAGAAAAALPPAWLWRLTGRRLVLPFYHLVADEAPAHIRHLYRVRTVAEFSRDLDYLCTHYQPLTLDALWDLVQTGQQPTRPSFLLSFDDGLRELYEPVLPLLRARGLTAMVFVNSAFVDNRALFYRYQASLLVERLHQSDDQAELHRVGEWAADHGLPAGPARQAPLRVDYLRRAALLELATQLDVDFAAFLQAQQPYLTSAQLHHLSDAGWALGAHSIDHPLYARLSLDAQLAQTVGSLDYVQTHFGPARRLFSFPFTDHGVPATFFTGLRGQADLTFGCAGLRESPYAGHLQRIPLERGRLSARAVIQGEQVYAWLRGRVGERAPA